VLQPLGFLCRGVQISWAHPASLVPCTLIARILVSLWSTEPEYKES
jgi:hypothetical protein